MGFFKKKKVKEVKEVSPEEKREELKWLIVKVRDWEKEWKLFGSKPTALRPRSLDEFIDELYFKIK